jgi:hypothetical protein
MYDGMKLITDHSERGTGNPELGTRNSELAPHTTHHEHTVTVKQ